MERVRALYAFANQLEHAGCFISAQVRDERYILLRQDASNLVVIYFVDGPLSNNAIKQALRDNTMRGIFSLFVVDEAMLPPDGQTTTIHPFINVMQTLFHGRVYAYRATNGDVEVFPVQLRTETSTTKRAVYESPIKVQELTCGHVETSYPMQGFWGTVNFRSTPVYEGPDPNIYRQQRQQASHQQRRMDSGVSIASMTYYEILGVDVSATEEQIKEAYRRLARQHHPDLNDSPAAKEQMQQINVAYRALMSQFD